MKKTLGLDLGSNSLGWAVLDDATGDILDKGVVVFPEGIVPAKKTTETPAAIRRAARMARRMKFRKRLRKWRLLEILIENGMCPLSKEELEAWKKEGRYPIANEKFLGWLKATDKQNPYCDRAAAADGPVPPEVLGRALYHIIQRRGFKSSRKDAAPGGEEDREPSAREKTAGEVQSGINELTETIRAAGCKTLGQYFKKILDEDRASPAKRRIRARYTGRIEHYEKEFEAIMDAQGVDSTLRHRLHDAIFHHRPLRSQKHLVGHCPLEKESPRAQIAHPAFEEFRMLAFINNLTLENENDEWRDATGTPLYPLSVEDRALIRTAFLTEKATFKFGNIAKLFKNDPRFKNDHLRFHYYQNDETLPSCSLWQRLATLFNEGKTSDPFAFQKEFDALTFYDNKDKLRAWFVKHHPELGDDAAERFINIHSREGYAQYSLKAIKKILPWLRKGFQLSDARFFAKLPEVVPDFAAHEEEVVHDLLAIEEAYHRERANRGRENARANEKPLQPLSKRWREYLEKTWGIGEAGWQQLYPSSDNPYQPQTEVWRGNEKISLKQPRLPHVQLGMIRNPVAQRAMTTLRRLVNYLAEHGKIDPSTTIRIELARTVNNAATREGWKLWQKSRQKLREDARATLVELGIEATDDAIDRVVLWEEQDKTCLYTGKTIAKVEQLFKKNGFDVEHTIPRCLSGDDSLANKTICDMKYNRQTKKGQIPLDCPNWEEIKERLQPWRKKLEKLQEDYRKQTSAARRQTEPQAKADARAKAIAIRFERDYWRDKLRRFDATHEQLEFGTGELTSFKKRQLVDTGIMTRHAVELLKCVYPRVFTVNGAATAFARKAWGIQGDDAKSRDEHTHHATDAIVIAALTPARFNTICTALKDDGKSQSQKCPPPYANFAEKVSKATGEILVKHVIRLTTLRQGSQRNVLARGDTVRGELHKDRFFGLIQAPGSEEKKFVVRKSLVDKVSVVKSYLKDETKPNKKGIVDGGINAIVKAAVQAAEAAGKTAFEPGDITMPSGVPILKVRIYAKPGQVELRNHDMPSRHDYKTPYYVYTAEGSNFRLAFFRRQGKFSAVLDNSLRWAQEHKKPGYLPLHEQDGFLGYVICGAMALVHTPNHPEELQTLPRTVLPKRLYKVVSFEKRNKDVRIILRFHSEARASTVLAQFIGSLPGRSSKGESKISLDAPYELLRLGFSTYQNQVMFEGIHFRMMLDGSIQFIEPS